MNPAVLDRVIEIVARAGALGPDERPAADTPLVGGRLLLDSVAVLELLLGLEKEFGLEISSQELLQTQSFKTVGSLAGFIDSRLSAKG